MMQNIKRFVSNFLHGIASSDMRLGSWDEWKWMPWLTLWGWDLLPTHLSWDWTEIVDLGSSEFEVILRILSLWNFQDSMSEGVK